jgi:hypothetical protein
MQYVCQVRVFLRILQNYSIYLYYKELATCQLKNFEKTKKFKKTPGRKLQKGYFWKHSYKKVDMGVSHLFLQIFFQRPKHFTGTAP